MGFDLYPWGGDFAIGNIKSPVAVVTLGRSLKLDKELVAVFGPDKTENLGIEKIIANVLSNPVIRFLVIAGPEVRGHMSGDTIRALLENGLDSNNRVVGAKGAVPYIENVPLEAVERFREQVEMVDMIDVEDLDVIHTKVKECIARDPGTFGEPYIVIKIEETGRKGPVLDDMLTMHNSLAIDPYGEIHSLLGAGADVNVHSSINIDVYGRVT